MPIPECLFIVFAPSGPRQITQPVIRFLIVRVTSNVPNGARPDKCQKYKMMYLDVFFRLPMEQGRVLGPLSPD